MERAGIKGYDFLLTSYKKILSNDAYEKIKKSFWFEVYQQDSLQ